MAVLPCIAATTPTDPRSRPQKAKPAAHRLPVFVSVAAS